MVGMPLLHRRVSGLVVVVVLVVAGCGDRGGVTAAHRERLASLVTDARKAAQARDGDGVRRALASLRASVRAARDRGEISPDDADRVLTAALQASRRARAEFSPAPTPAATPAPTAAATPAPAAPAPPGKAKGKDNGEGKGEGKGEKDDD